MSGPVVVPVGPGVGMCLHPRAETERRLSRPRWLKARAGNRWRLQRARERAFWAVRCPDCPAQVYQLDTGQQTGVVLAPRLVPLAPVSCRRLGETSATAQVASRLRVHRLLPGCWEAWCGQCAFLTNTGLVTQVGSWERAMLRAVEHLAEIHAVSIGDGVSEQR